MFDGPACVFDDQIGELCSVFRVMIFLLYCVISDLGFELSGCCTLARSLASFFFSVSLAILLVVGVVSMFYFSFLVFLFAAAIL